MEQIVRLDEFDGTLRRGVPEELREKDGQWVEMRRYTPRTRQREFEWELTQWERNYRADPNVASRTDGTGVTTWELTKEYLDAREHIWRRMVIDRVVDWSFRDDDGKAKLPLEPASFEKVPGVFADAMIAAVLRFNAPVGDEEAFRLGHERQSSPPQPNGASTERGRGAVSGRGLVEPVGAQAVEDAGHAG